MRSLTFFIPGLFGPVSDTTLIDSSPGNKPDIPSIENHFRVGSSKRTQTTGFIPALFQLFGFPEYEKDYPVAAVTHLVDDDHDQDGIWMRADPVHLRPERESIVLLDDSSFKLEKHEALILAADLQKVFTERGIRLEAPTNNRWYINLRHLPDITTTPIHEVVGEDIHQNLFAGNDKILWDQLSNEAQMSLHNCPLNSEREARGLLPVNGVWLWGAGDLPGPTKRPAQRWSGVFGDEVTTQGLSMLTGSPYVELPDNIEALINQFGQQDDADNEYNLLVVISFGLRHKQYYDHEGWLDFIAYLEDEWFAGVEKLIRQKQVDILTVHTGGKRLTVTKNSFMKFWQRRKSLYAYR